MIFGKRNHCVKFSELTSCQVESRGQNSLSLQLLNNFSSRGDRAPQADAAGNSDGGRWWSSPTTAVVVVAADQTAIFLDLTFLSKPLLLTTTPRLRPARGESRRKKRANL